MSILFIIKKTVYYSLFVLLETFYFAAFKITFFSPNAPITSDECHALFHLNAASPAARNTEQVKHYKNLVRGRIWSTNTARPPDYKSNVITTRPQLAWYNMDWTGNVQMKSSMTFIRGNRYIKRKIILTAAK